MTAKDRCVPVFFPPDLYPRLRHQAEEQDRHPFEQARHLIRQGLERQDQVPLPSPTVGAQEGAA